MVEQKGYDTMAKALDKTLTKLLESNDKEPPLIVLVGSGSDEIIGHIKNLKDKISEKNPEAGRRILLLEGFAKEVGKAIQLNGDLFSIPSNFEPCGLTQMEAMAKGNLPVTTSTGGLVNTIDNGVDGFRTEVFYSGGQILYNADKSEPKHTNNTSAYADTLNKAFDTFYQEPDKFKEMSKNAMKKDFSWDAPGGSLDKYIKLFTTGKIN
jgi:glycogen synthase